MEYNISNLYCSKLVISAILWPHLSSCPLNSLKVAWVLDWDWRICIIKCTTDNGCNMIYLPQFKHFAHQRSQPRLLFFRTAPHRLDIRIRTPNYRYDVRHIIRCPSQMAVRQFTFRSSTAEFKEAKIVSCFSWFLCSMQADSDWTIPNIFSQIWSKWPWEDVPSTHPL